MSNLVLKYIGGLAIGAALVGGYAGVRHVMRDEPTVLPSRDLQTVPETVPAYELSVEPVIDPALYAERPAEPGEVSELPTACAEYLRVMERYAECKELPEEARSQFRQAIDAVRTSFDSLDDLPLDSRKAMEDGCAQSVDAILESGKLMGCQM
jgi:uncharacterized membrane protein